MATNLRDAATVLPLRDMDGSLEVFMVKRNSALGFMGGVHVFPGGVVDEDDSVIGWKDALSGYDGERSSQSMHKLDADRTLGYHVAAVRELFEEAGVLLACDSSGHMLGGARDAELVERLGSRRAELAGGAVAFMELLVGEGLKIAADALHYFAHWITPEPSPKRYDTRFFLAAMPAGQKADHDRVESVEGDWYEPRQALDLYLHRKIKLAPPTLCALDRVALHDTVAEALEAAVALDVGEVKPKISVGEDAVAILYPGDDDYDSGVAVNHSSGRILNRRVLRDGLWVKP